MEIFDAGHVEYDIIKHFDATFYSLGLMADKVGNYIAAFLMAGGGGILASLIPFLLLCLKRELNIDSDIGEVEGDRGQIRMGARREKDELDHVGEDTTDNNPLSIVVIESTIW